MRRRALAFFAILLIAMSIVAGCDRSSPSPETALACLEARAVLPADTFFGDGPVGTALDTVVNGRRLPCAAVPVQGFGSILLLPDDDVLVLQDNGFGTRANSGDYPLRWYRLHVDWRSGGVTLVQAVTLTDPGRLLPFPLTRPDSLLTLTGGDLDPEAFVRMDDGTFWVADELGPSLVHVAPDGRVLNKPVFVPVPVALRAFARGSPFLRSPDHPDLRVLRQDASRRALANLPRSAGFEGLARNRTGSRLYAATEKGLLDDPAADRRMILEFDPARRSFTGKSWPYRTTRPDGSVTSLEAVDDLVFLVLERGPGEGRRAEFKRLYRVELGDLDGDGYLVKTLVCDLLVLDDRDEVTRDETGAVGLGRRFSFPYVTPEAVAIVDPSTLVLVNDNNYPFSAGRRAGRPDDSDFIRLHLLQPLQGGGRAGDVRE